MRRAPVVGCPVLPRSSPTERTTGNIADATVLTFKSGSDLKAPHAGGRFVALPPLAETHRVFPRLRVGRTATRTPPITAHAALGIGDTAIRARPDAQPTPAPPQPLSA